MEYSLYQNTLDTIDLQGYTPNDVEYVGDYDGHYSLSWKEFTEQAAKLDYDDPHLNDFIIMFKDGVWLEHYFTDEWSDNGEFEWALIKRPKTPQNTKPFNLVNDN